MKKFENKLTHFFLWQSNKKYLQSKQNKVWITKEGVNVLLNVLNRIDRIKDVLDFLDEIF
jgi:hypothetical protein